MAKINPNVEPKKILKTADQANKHQKRFLALVYFEIEKKKNIDILHDWTSKNDIQKWMYPSDEASINILCMDWEEIGLIEVVFQTNEEDRIYLTDDGIKYVIENQLIKLITELIR